ncbi:MAG TPA: CHAT domain-containing protein [Acidimicrobiales bacterium]|nr:CHAT domain-containing protein [Acidimicrobiales bacterium]
MESAESAVELCSSRPHEAADRAREILGHAEGDGDLELLSIARRVLGLAARESGDVLGAQRHLEASLEAALAGGLGQREGESRMSLAAVLSMCGRTDEALHQADLAACLLEGVDTARVQVQRALILQRLGRHDGALAGYGAALSAFGAFGRPADQAGVRLNRGILLAYRGDLSGAEADLAAAEASYHELGLDLAAAEVHHNLGFVATLQGDVPLALRRYDAAAREFRRIGAARPAAVLDQCQALLSVGLVHEARCLAQRAVERLGRAGMEVDLAEARLVLAQTCWLGGDAAEARSQASRARAAFDAQGRAPWACLARHVVLRAAWHEGALDAGDIAEARATAEELEASGWSVPAADARLVAAGIALGAGRVADAEADLVRASATRRVGPVDLRARAWHAEALLRLARGDRPGAFTALRAGLAVLDQHRATLGATELRAHAAGAAAELAHLGLGLALEGRRPAQVLAWSERWRAGSHRVPAARPPADPAIAADLASLRLAVREAEEAVLAGTERADLRRQRARLEASIRRRARHSSVPGVAPPPPPPGVGDLAARLGDRALVQLVESKRQLYAVTVAAGRSRLWELGPASGVGTEVDQLRFCLGRLAHRRGSEASRAAAAAALDHAAGRLDGLLLTPLRPAVGDRPLVVVPTGMLHGLPWAVLPSCRERPLAVAPSCAQWAAAHDQHEVRSPARAVLVAGPGAHHAQAEIAELSPLHPSATALVGEEATVAAVNAAMDGAALAHVAAHGTFRADNPLFSCLHLSDGQLTVYDLEALAAAPRLVVLSACDAGISAVNPGDELMGLAAALLARGTQSVVASVLPVPDAATRRLMFELHQRLAEGMAPARALAGAHSAVATPLDPADAVAVRSFTCFGAG